jgi:hypothetical protein
MTVRFVPWPITLPACAKGPTFSASGIFHGTLSLKNNHKQAGLFQKSPAFFSDASFFIRSLLISLAFIVFKLLLA